MTIKRYRGAAAAVAAATALASVLTGCAANEQSAGTSGSGLSGSLAGVGSSAQGTAQTTWIAGFQTANPGVTVNYDPQGSGAGRTAFLAGAADFAGSDAALTADELAGEFKACASGATAWDLPVYISPIAIAYHLKGVDELRLDAATVAGIFKGEITTWNDPAIAAQNKGQSLPDTAITVVHRSDDSGTTQNFTEYLSAAAGDVWTAPPSQTFPYKVGDAAKGTSGVGDAVRAADGSITYLDESGASGLSLARLKVGNEYVTLSAKGAAAVVAASPVADGRAKNDLAIAIDRTGTEPGSWPLVLVSYLIVCDDYADDATAGLVKAYAGYIASKDAQQAAAEHAGSAPLSADLAARVQAAVEAIR